MHLPRGAVLLFVGLILAGFAALSFPGSNRIVEGAVTDANGPVADAIVRWQGTSNCTRTDSQGRYRLLGAIRARALIAAKPGHPIVVGSARQPNLHLQPIPQNDNDEYAWIDPSPNPRQPLQCGNCHGQIHDEWSRSAHGNSATNRKFLHLFAGTDGASAPSKTWNLLEEHPLGSGVCAACHAPTLTSPDLDYDVRLARGVHAHGVHCDYCHKIADAPTDKLGTRFGRDGYRLARPHGNEQIFFGPLDDAVRAGESFVYAPFYKESRYCASCHEGVVFGVHVYGTYSEWLESPARRQGQQCQDCHMAPTGKMTNLAPGQGGIERDPRTLASHGFPGGTSEMLKKCLEVKSTATRRGKEVIVMVTTQARNVGHRVPTGFIDRHLVLVVEALNERGRQVQLSAGPELPPRAGPTLAGRPGWIFGKQHLDVRGRPVPFWQTAHAMLDTRLAPDDADVRTFKFAQDAADIRVRLVYRRFWAEVAAPRGWTDNDVVIHDQTIARESFHEPMIGRVSFHDRRDLAWFTNAHRHRCFSRRQDFDTVGTHSTSYPLDPSNVTSKKMSASHDRQV